MSTAIPLPETPAVLVPAPAAVGMSVAGRFPRTVAPEDAGGLPSAAPAPALALLGDASTEALTPASAEGVAAAVVPGPVPVVIATPLGPTGVRLALRPLGLMADPDPGVAAVVTIGPGGFAAAGAVVVDDGSAAAPTPGARSTPVCTAGPAGVVCAPLAPGWVSAVVTAGPATLEGCPPPGPGLALAVAAEPGPTVARASVTTAACDRGASAAPASFLETSSVKPESAALPWASARAGAAAEDDGAPGPGAPAGGVGA